MAPIRPGYDFLYYNVFAGDRLVPLMDLPEQERDRLLDLGNAVYEIVEKVPCPEHVGSSNVVTVSLSDGATTVHAWACCVVRYYLLSAVIARYKVPVTVSCPVSEEPVDLVELRARLARYMTDLMSRNDAPSVEPGLDGQE